MCSQQFSAGQIHSLNSSISLTAPKNMKWLHNQIIWSLLNDYHMWHNLSKIGIWFRCMHCLSMLFGNQLVTSEGERNTQMPQTIDSTSIYIMCTYIYLSNAYGNLDTRVNIHLWAEGHISVPLREQIHMKRVSGFTGPWKLDGSNTTPPLQSTHTWRWNAGAKRDHHQSMIRTFSKSVKCHQHALVKLNTTPNWWDLGLQTGKQEIVPVICSSKGSLSSLFVSSEFN